MMTTIILLSLISGLAVLYSVIILHNRTPQEKRLLSRLLIPLMGCGVLLYSVMGRPFLPSSPYSTLTQEHATKTTTHNDDDDMDMDIEAFRELLQQATQALPTQTQDPTPWIVVTSEWMALNETAQARSLLTQGIELFPNNVDLLSRYALLEQQSQPLRAVPLWHHIHALDPHHTQALWFLALHAQSQEHYTQGRQFLTQLIEQLDMDNDAHVKLHTMVQQRLAQYPKQP